MTKKHDTRNELDTQSNLEKWSVDNISSKDMHAQINCLEPSKELPMSQLRRERCEVMALVIAAKRKARKIQLAIATMTIVYLLLVIGIISWCYLKHFDINTFLPYIACGLCVLLMLIRMINPRNSDDAEYKSIEAKVAEYDEAIFLKEIEEGKPEEKALRHLLEKEKSLNAYHEINKKHITSLYKWGVRIIIIGIFTTLAVLVYTLFSGAKISNIVTVAGFLSGLLIDCVGAVFIAMYSKAMESANAFEKSIVTSVSNYLGNLLAAQIEDESIRAKVLAEMAKELSKVK